MNRVGMVLVSAVVLLLAVSADARDVNVSNIRISSINEEAQTCMVHYTLSRTNPSISEQQPVWVFVKYRLSTDTDYTGWQDTDNTDGSDDSGTGGQIASSTVNLNLSGDIGIVTSWGDKAIVWSWGTLGTRLARTDRVKVRVRAIEMVYVPADASFTMGNDDAWHEVDGTADIQALYIMKYPVTQEMYAGFLNEQANNHDPVKDHDYWYPDAMTYESWGGYLNISGTMGLNAVWAVDTGKENFPIRGTSWHNAYDFARWAGLRLLIEEEFEKTARGMDSRRYAWGNRLPDSTLCNYNSNVGNSTDVRAYESAIDAEGGTPYGAYDLAGNVMEWMDTYWYDTGLYDSSKSGTHYDDGNTSQRVVRGGYDGASWVRAADRHFNMMGFNNIDMGFRCAHSAE